MGGFRLVVVDRRLAGCRCWCYKQLVAILSSPSLLGLAGVQSSNVFAQLFLALAYKILSHQR